MVRVLAFLAASCAPVWAEEPPDNSGPQSCGEFVSEIMGPGYVGAQSEPTGNGGTRCYYKSANDDGKAVSYGVIWPREATSAPEPKASEDEGTGAAPAPKPEPPAPKKGGKNGDRCPMVPTPSPRPSPPAGCGGPTLTFTPVGYNVSDFQADLDAAYARNPNPAGGLDAGWLSGRNVAILELTSGQRYAFTSTPHGCHSEEHAINWLNANGTPYTQVKRLYTELSPCADYCLPALKSYFAGYEKCVGIQFTWPHQNSPDRAQLQRDRRDRVTGG